MLTIKEINQLITDAMPEQYKKDPDPEDVTEEWIAAFFDACVKLGFAVEVAPDQFAFNFEQHMH